MCTVCELSRGHISLLINRAISSKLSTWLHAQSQSLNDSVQPSVLWLCQLLVTLWLKWKSINKVKVLKIAKKNYFVTSKSRLFGFIISSLRKKKYCKSYLSTAMRYFYFVTKHHRSLQNSSSSWYSTQTGVRWRCDVGTSAAKACWDASSTWHDGGIPVVERSNFHRPKYSTQVYIWMHIGLHVS